MTGPYTPKPREAASSASEATDARDSRFEGLHAEASAAVGCSANTIRQVREGYRRAYADALSRWQDLRDELDGIDRSPRYDSRPSTAGDPAAVRTTDEAVLADEAALAAEAGANDARRYPSRTWRIVFALYPTAALASAWSPSKRLSRASVAPLTASIGFRV
jgi:hypothetical protein